MYPFLLLAGIVLAGCSGQPVVWNEKELTYPQSISSIFFLDTLRVPKPIVVYIDSLPYITSVEVFNSVRDKTKLRGTPGVLRYLTEELVGRKWFDYSRIYFDTGRNGNKYFYSLYAQNNLEYIERIITFLDSIQGLPVYRFDFRPRKFLLALVADSIESYRPYDPGYKSYSNDYVLALLPVFPEGSLMILKERCTDYYIMTEDGCYLEEYDPSKHR